jgi:anti-sigma regulatory factor (Ser/Thr protein kinase)
MSDHGRPGGMELGRLCVPVNASSPKAFRHLIGVIGDQWDIAPENAYAAQVAVSEIVTNVVSHAPGVPGSTVSVSVSRVGDLLSVRVHDSSPDAPVLRSAGEDDESGRGLMLVDALTDAWGYRLTPSGKVVWFDLKTDWPCEAAV